jgi:type IV secretion system protein TrbL
VKRILSIWTIGVALCCGSAFAWQAPQAPVVVNPTPAPNVNGGTIVIVPNGPVISAPSDIIDLYEAAAGHWMAMLKDAAYDIFWTLTALDLAWFSIEIVLVYRMNHTIAAMMSMKKILVLSLFLALLGNADSWLPIIINTFPQLGSQATGITSIMPSDILATGLTMSGKLLSSAVKSSFTLDLGAMGAFLIAAIGILLSFCWLTGQFVLAKVETILALGTGYPFLAFGGSRWTAGYVERYWTFAVSAGIKMMTQYILLGLGTMATRNWVNQVNGLSLWILNAEVAWSVLAGTLIYVMVCWGCSKLASSILAGSPSLTGSDMLGIAGSAISAVAMASSLIPGVGAVTSAAGTGAGKAVSAAGASAGSGSAPSTPAAAPVAAASSSGSSNAKPPASAPGFASKAAEVAGRIISNIPHAGPHGGGAPRFGGFAHD